ncbi:MAG: MMPL family transporter [Aeromicrobium erythreum]
MSSSLYALGRWAYRHHRRVFASWLLALVLAGVAAGALGSGLRDDFEIPGTEAQDAIDALGRTFPELSGASAYLVVVAPPGQSMRDPEAKAAVRDTIRRMEKVDRVTDVVSPYSDLADTGISKDGRAAQVQVQFRGSLEEIGPPIQKALQRTDAPLQRAGYETSFGGDVFASRGPQLSLVEVFGVVVALGVLYLTFRSWRAAVMPVVTAVIGVAFSMAIVFALTGVMTVSTTAPLLALMIGLAVGIDYALFIVSRYRELLGQGVEGEEATGRAVATAGSAVVFAGVTVMIALVGLAIARIPFLTVMGVVAAFAVLVAVAVAITLLPAMLGQAGDRMRPRQSDKPAGSFARRWVGATTRFPLVAIAIIVVGLAVVAIPAKGLELALPDNGTAPEGSTQRTAFDLIDENFGPGYNGPLLVTMDIIGTTDPVGVVKDVERDLRTVPGVAAIGLATPNRTADTAVVQVIPETGPSSPRTAELVHDIRDRAPTWEKEHDVTVSVTGLTAAGVDVSERLKGALLPFGVVVVGLSVLLLMIVFRSVLVPVKATLGFLLSTGAAFGAVVAVFQWGWLRHAVHLDQPGELVSFLPILLMAMLFGLSMDYEVFLMSRMKEEYVRSGDAQTSIVDGFVGSSKVVTAAAVIMLAVFAAFVPEGDIAVRQIAFALAVGVFCDAFLVRMLFAPAVMRLAGRRAWWVPARLEKSLPHVDVEGEGLHRQVELASWPRDGRDHALVAAGLTTSGPEGLVFNDVSLDVPRGDWLVVHGPSGSGKTALLLTLAGRMTFDTGRLRVLGRLLPQETAAVRRRVALGELAGINDLEDNLSVDQHVAERLSIATFGLWVPRSRITPLRDRLNRALDAAHREAGVPFTEVRGDALVANLSRLERKALGALLALAESPEVVVVEDVDDLRDPAAIDLLWRTLAHLLEDTDVTLVASVLSPAAAPAADPASSTVHLLELDTHRVVEELSL